MPNMKEFTTSARIDVQRLDAEGIQAINSELARALTQAAAQGAEARGKFHIRLSFSKSNNPHTKIVIGDPPGPEGPTPNGPTGG